MLPLTPDSRRRPPRRGAILLVVLAMLALFAVIGLSFVLYAESAATSAQTSMESFKNDIGEGTGGGLAVGSRGVGLGTEARNAAKQFLGQLVYPTADTGDATLSALRGYDMARMVWGYNADPTNLNCIAYNGHGGFHETITLPGGAGTIPRSQVLNWSYQFNRLAPTKHAILDPEHSSANPRSSPTAAIPTTAVYVGKNAAYTYPDRNNAYVAIVDPATGQVIIPSCHRPSLFRNASRPTTESDLDQLNPNWLNDAGRFMILRPRPADHRLTATDTPTFPYPPKNPDGTITGDVQNWRWGTGAQRNDSVWLNPNLIFQIPGTNPPKYVAALIAPMVIPLDGRINLNVAGNIRGTGGVHASNQGFGPWEINLSANPSPILSATTAKDLVARRYTGQAYTTATAVPFPPGVTSTAMNPYAFYFHPNLGVTGQTTPGSGSAVDWDGATTVASATPQMQLPGYPAKLFGTTPLFPGSLTTPTGPYDSSSFSPGSPMMMTQPSGEAYRHPGQFNPLQYNPSSLTVTAAAGRTFPLSDLKQFAARYSGPPSVYEQTYLGRTFPSELGASAGSNPTTPANSTRQLVTLISNSLKRAGVAPNVFGDGSGTGVLQLTAPTLTPNTFLPPVWQTAPSFDVAAPTLTTPATGPTAPSDLRAATPADVRAVTAALGAVDVNRPLTDYRTDLNSPLSPGNVSAANVATATADRQQLANDIFARLLVATGSASTTAGNGLTTINLTTGAVTVNVTSAAMPQQYDAVRWLAQLAVNVVDYVDNDDIITPFVWNTAVGTNDFSVTTAVNAGVVFGVEKPRLVINEVYAELANDKADKSNVSATTALRLRYYIELLNPGTSDTRDATSALAGPDTTNPGAVALRYHSPADYSVYKVHVYKASDTALGQLLATTDNVMGLPSTPSVLEVDFTSVTLPAGNLAEWVEPNDGKFASNGTARNGFAVLSPGLASADGDNTAYIPDQTTAPFSNALTVSVLDHDTTDQKKPAEIKPYVDTQNQSGGHVVLLRRLLCPYQTFNAATNPYITVDVQGHVKVNDAVKIGTDPDGNGGDDGTRLGASVGPTAEERFAIGRVQPFTAAGDPLTQNYPATLVLKQKNVPGGTASGQQHTMFRHNSIAQAGSPSTPPTIPGPNAADETLLSPFAWLTHLDRRLISTPELLHVSAVKPHEVTTRFAVPSTSPLAFQMHTAASAGMGGTVSASIGTPPAGSVSPLYRALETLTVKPWTHNAPEGGRVAGRVNVNMIWDPRVLKAILDKQLVNQFTDATTTGDVDTIFAALKASRSPGWADTANATEPTKWVKSTVHETGVPGDDRPIRSLGTPTLATGGSLSTAVGLSDTLLQRRASDGQPLFYRKEPDPTNPLHPYQAAEPFQKAFNNLTTVSDCYLVVFTVGFFEVRNPPNATAPFYNATNPPVLGAEVFGTVPGDARSQYVAVVDRTQLGVDNSTPTPAQVPGVWTAELTASVKNGDTSLKFPVQSANLTATIPTFTVNSDGKAFTLQKGSYLRLGTGDGVTNSGDGEWVMVNTFTYDPATGTVTVALDTINATAVQRYHPAGSPVSNALLRNPGPQTAFDPSSATYKGVVPYFEAITP